MGMSRAIVSVEVHINGAPQIFMIGENFDHTASALGDEIASALGSAYAAASGDYFSWFDAQA